MQVNKGRNLGTSSLAKPSFEAFLHYSDLFIEAGQYSNNGPCTNLLEKRLAQFHQCKYCVTFVNGFWALVLALDCIKLKGKSDILMPSLTYRRMSDLVSWANLNPIYYDVSPDTLTTTTEHVEEKITKNTAIILGVHPIVNCYPVKQVKSLCDKNNIPFIMDSVESAYEMNDGSRVGTEATVEIFSMHASKLLNGCEGGYATTNDKDLYAKLKVLKGFGFEGPDIIKYEDGINAKLNEMHAAMALANLDSLEILVKHNKEIYEEYKKQLFNIRGIKLMHFNEAEKTSYKNIVAKVNSEFPVSRDQLVDLMHSNSFIARPYYSPPLHIKHEYDAKLPFTEHCSLNHLILPSGYQVSKDNVTQICKLIRGIS